MVSAHKPSNAKLFTKLNYLSSCWHVRPNKLHNVNQQMIDYKSRPSDRVHRYGTAQFSQTRTITYNLRKVAKSRTIRKCLLEILIKTGISIEYQDFQNMFRLFSDHLPSKTTRRLRYPNNKVFLPQPVLSWALVYF